MVWRWGLANPYKHTYTYVCAWYVKTAIETVKQERHTPANANNEIGLMRIWQAFATLNTVTNDSMGDKNSDTIRIWSEQCGARKRTLTSWPTDKQAEERNECESQNEAKIITTTKNKQKNMNRNEYIKWAKNVCTMDNKPHARVNPKIKTEANSIHVEKNVQARLHFFVYLSFNSRFEFEGKEKKTTQQNSFFYY